MKNQFRSFLLIASLTALFTACENSSDPAPQSQLLSGGSSRTWKVVSIKKDGSDRFQSSCEADNLYTFYAGSSFELDEGNKKCRTTDPQKQIGTWSLTSSAITIKQGSRSFMQMEIKSVTSSRLVVTNEIGGEKVETTFQAQ
jgi:hypothetical protein